MVEYKEFVADGVGSDDVRRVSGIPQGSVKDPLLYLLRTSNLTMILKNTFVGYADSSTLLVEARCRQKYCIHFVFAWIYWGILIGTGRVFSSCFIVLTPKISTKIYKI